MIPIVDPSCRNLHLKRIQSLITTCLRYTVQVIRNARGLSNGTSDVLFDQLTIRIYHSGDGGLNDLDNIVERRPRNKRRIRSRRHCNN